MRRSLPHPDFCDIEHALNFIEKLPGQRTGPSGFAWRNAEAALRAVVSDGYVTGAPHAWRVYREAAQSTFEYEGQKLPERFFDWA